MGQIFSAALGWLLRKVVVQFVVLLAIFEGMSMMWVVLEHVVGLGGFLSVSAVNDALAGIPSGVWFFLAMFRADIGIKMVISAYATRFLIRRLPVIG